VHHTDCGMETFHDDQVKDKILAETGLRPSFALEAFPDAVADVKQTAARIKANPFVSTRTSAASSTKWRQASSARSPGLILAPGAANSRAPGSVNDLAVSLSELDDVDAVVAGDVNAREA